MTTKEEIAKELDTLIKIRTEFYDFLDANIPMDKRGINYDFSSNPTLDAKSVYSHFHKLDYQARKLRGYLVKAYDLKAE
ncbi:MAG: hypothetical protein R3331_11995 [Sulfurospirillaceae bacterium]|nr:hypothetical protein [Sulfurospirillaceae bacterium]